MARRTPTDGSQLGLFAAPPDPLLAVHREAAALAARLPSGVRFGTSSWSFPGWRGLVWSQARSESQLARDGLAEYARHPLLTTVGVDRGYYAPIPPADLARYAQQLPAGFRACFKAPEALTAPVHTGHGRGEPGAPNPHFLDAAYFDDVVAEPLQAAFADHAGPVMLEFPPTPHRLAPAAFAEQLDAFLERLPRALRYAVELRDRSHLTPAYGRVLARHGAAHVYNYWSRMPLPGEQARVVPITAAPFAIVRLLLRPGTRYDDRKASFAPFDRLVDVDVAMRASVVELIRAATGDGRVTYVLVNNKAEGSAPLTIRALAEQLAA